MEEQFATPKQLTVRTGPRGGKWARCRINKSFLQDLWNEFQTDSFTTAEAYKTYEGSGRVQHSPTDRYWIHMNVRNSLYAANAQGILKIVRPGIFQFEKDPTITEREYSSIAEAICKTIDIPFPNEHVTDWLHSQPSDWVLLTSIDDLTMTYTESI